NRSLCCGPPLGEQKRKDRLSLRKRNSQWFFFKMVARAATERANTTSWCVYFLHSCFVEQSGFDRLRILGTHSCCMNKKEGGCKLAQMDGRDVHHSVASIASLLGDGVQMFRISGRVRYGDPACLQQVCFFF